jgi:K+-sensing histidine kinase KdpD
VVAVAANGDRPAGVLAAVSTAVWFDFFLTQPYERFTITRRTDIETTVLLLVIGVAVTEIAVWGRRHYAISSRRAGYLDGINNAARAVAAGGSAPALIDQVSSQLAQLLSLRSCIFQYGVAGRPGCIATARSLSGSGAGRRTARASRPAPTWSCWWKAGVSSRAGS